MRLRHRLSVLVLSGSVLFGPLGCVGTQTGQIISSHGALPASVEIERVPFYPQEQYYCGPASLAMALAWSGVSLTPDEAAAQVYTPGREGTFAPDMIAAARRNGRLAVEVRELDDWNATGEKGADKLLTPLNMGVGATPEKEEPKPAPGAGGLGLMPNGGNGGSGGDADDPNGGAPAPKPDEEEVE